MFCPQCGKEISDTSKFCQYCGGRIESNPKEETTVKSNKSNTKTLQKKPFNQIIKSLLIFVVLIILFIIFTYLFFQYMDHKYKSDNIKSSVQTDIPKSTVETVVPKPKPSSDWVECYKNEDGNVFSYKIGDIDNNKGKSIVQVWVKTVYSDKGREKVIQGEKTKRHTTEGWDKLSDEKWLYQIDCKKQGFNVVSFDYYDTDGKIFYSKVYNKPEWGNIIPNSILDISQKEVCK